jgi:hypothetical protein
VQAVDPGQVGKDSDTYSKEIAVRLIEHLRWTASPFGNADQAAVPWKSKTTQCFLLAVNYFGSNEVALPLTFGE